MAYSGSIGQTVFSTRKVIENAFRRGRLPAAQITAEMVDIAKDQLFLILNDITNQGTQLWCIEKEIYPLYEGKGLVEMSDGTVDILNFNLRTLQPASGTDSATATAFTTDFSGVVTISTIGVLWSAAAAPVQLMCSDDGIVWTDLTPETVSATDVGAGEWTWFDLETAVSARYFRIEATVGTLDTADVVMSGQPSEIPLYRMNRDDYTNLPNKTFRGQPNQFWFDRQIPNAFMHLWPVPNVAATQHQIVLWRHRAIMDVGSLAMQIEVPNRWYMAIVTELARQVAREVPEIDVSLLPQLDADAREAMPKARIEERDNSPIYMAPAIGMYTR